MGTTGDAGGICSRLCESVPCGVRGVIRLVFAIWICVYLNLAVAVCVSWPRGMWVWIRSAARFMRANWRRWSADPSQMKKPRKRGRWCLLKQRTLQRNDTSSAKKSCKCTTAKNTSTSDGQPTWTKDEETDHKEQSSLVFVAQLTGCWKRARSGCN